MYIVTLVNHILLFIYQWRSFNNNQYIWKLYNRVPRDKKTETGFMKLKYFFSFCLYYKFIIIFFFLRLWTRRETLYLYIYFYIHCICIIASNDNNQHSMYIICLSPLIGMINILILIIYWVKHQQLFTNSQYEKNVSKFSSDLTQLHHAYLFYFFLFFNSWKLITCKSRGEPSNWQITQANRYYTSLKTYNYCWFSHSIMQDHDRVCTNTNTSHYAS